MKIMRRALLALPFLFFCFLCFLFPAPLSFIALGLMGLILILSPSFCLSLMATSSPRTSSFQKLEQVLKNEAFLEGRPFPRPLFTSGLPTPFLILGSSLKPILLIELSPFREHGENVFLPLIAEEMKSPSSQFPLLRSFSFFTYLLLKKLAGPPVSGRGTLHFRKGLRILWHMMLYPALWYIERLCLMTNPRFGRENGAGGIQTEGGSSSKLLESFWPYRKARSGHRA